MALETAHSAALSQQVFTRFTAVAIHLPAALGGPIYLLDGAGFLTMAHLGTSTTFKGFHAVYGTLGNAPDVSTQTANNSPNVDILLMPPTGTAIGAISQPSAQNSRVYVYEGALNPETGLVIGSPLMLWAGRIDTTEVTATETNRAVRIITCGALERFFEPRASAALNDVWHQWAFGLSSSILAANISAAQPTPWGKDGAAKVTTTVGGSGGYSGGGGGSYGGGGGWLTNLDMMSF